MLLCATAAVFAAAPVAMAQGNPPASSSASASPGYTPADVHFMQGMIGHHAQALEMAALVPDRTTNKSIHLLAERIEVSQKDEIALMRHWLETRHESAPDPSAKDQMSGHDTSGMSGMSTPMMPGMLSPEQMKRLAAAKGAAFDRLFLTDMIQHHEGALAMVKDLFTKPGAGQEPETFQFASDVDVDQRAEIARMRALLVKLSASPK
jgi:uncharacterized protein (DUF305 family)